MKVTIRIAGEDLYRHYDVNKVEFVEPFYIVYQKNGEVVKYPIHNILWISETEEE